MHSSTKQVVCIVLVLVLAGLSVAFYKAIWLGFPVFPGEHAKVWEIEAEIVFEAEPGPVTVSMAVPDLTLSAVSLLSATDATYGYGMREVERNGKKRIEWTRQDAQGRQRLYYKIKVQQAINGQHKRAESPSDAPIKSHPEVAVDAFPFMTSGIEGSYRVAADDLIEQMRQQSSSPVSLASLLIRALDPAGQNTSAAFLRELAPNESARTDLVMQLLHEAGLSVRKVRGVRLEEGRRHQPIEDIVEVLSNNRWVAIDPDSGEEGLPENFMPWQQGGESLLDVIGGHDSSVQFAVIARSVALEKLAVTAAKLNDAALVDFSLYSLPIAEQNAYRYILLIPIGTLIVVLMRILIGLRTSGTFMPVLMALAFLQTEVLPGLVIFIVVVSMGLWIRFILSRLNLLLVARISSVVIVVLGIMVSMSILSYKLGIVKALSVSYFPLIILAWTIERMSILWEEEGPMEVVVTGGGSLLVAVIAYFAMTNPFIEHVTFNFPELMLVELGATLLLGQYTGYRLLELRRFRPLAQGE